MNVLDLSRWQFGITTVYHFLFIPVTIGMAFLVAGFETAWLRSGDERWLKLTRFYGRLFLINFAMGVVTGIVQEFQFGMNWSAYSRAVGDIFGAPLAIEALLAFFVESTFLGLWIFGWERLGRRVHNACMWLVAVATALSAYFILTANSWMQHPVGYRYNPHTHREELTSFLALITNPAQLAAFPHVLGACFLTGGALVASIAMWHLIRRPGTDTAAFRSAVRAGAITALAAAVLTVATGDIQGKLFTTRYQPMKMASAEALYHTAQPAPLSLLTIGNLSGSRPVFEITLPRLLSFLGTGNWNGQVQGIDNLQSFYSQVYGPGSYTPVVPVTYWSFRLMIGLGLLAAVIALAALWAVRRDTAGRGHTEARSGRRRRGLARYLPGGFLRTPARAVRAAEQVVRRSTWGRRLVLWSVLALPLLPLAANTSGWILTEMGRQPWLVYGQIKTAAGVSANSGGEVLTSLIALSLIYGFLAVIEGGLMIRYARAGLAAGDDEAGSDGAEMPAALVY